MKHDLISHTPIVQNGFKYNKNMNVIISAIWILMLLSILLIFPQSLEFLGIYGYKDIWYWLFIIVTIYLLQITATGFSGVISSILLIYKLNNKILEGNKTYLYILLEEDKEVADKLVGFCFASSLYFSSGVLFVPTLLVYMNNSNSYIAHIFVLFAIILYSIFILLAYLIPLFIMEGNIKKYKADKIDEIKRKYENVVQKNEHLRIVSYYLQMKYVDDENIMPESLERMLKIFTVAIIPILAFVINNIAIIQDIIKFINTHVKV